MCHNALWPVAICKFKLLFGTWGFDSEIGSTLWVHRATKVLGGHLNMARSWRVSWPTRQPSCTYDLLHDHGFNLECCVLGALVSLELSQVPRKSAPE